MASVTSVASLKSEETDDELFVFVVSVDSVDSDDTEDELFVFVFVVSVDSVDSDDTEDELFVFEFVLSVVSVDSVDSEDTDEELLVDSEAASSTEGVISGNVASATASSEGAPAGAAFFLLFALFPLLFFAVITTPASSLTDSASVGVLIVCTDSTSASSLAFNALLIFVAETAPDDLRIC